MSNDNKPAAAQEAVAPHGWLIAVDNKTPLFAPATHPDIAEALRGIEGATVTEVFTAPVAAAPEWQPIDTAPKDDRVLVRCESGSVYAAHWVQNPMTGDEAWLVCALEDGTQMLVHPVEWMPLPLAARPQEASDA